MELKDFKTDKRIHALGLRLTRSEMEQLRGSITSWLEDEHPDPGDHVHIDADDYDAEIVLWEQPLEDLKTMGPGAVAEVFSDAALASLGDVGIKCVGSAFAPQSQTFRMDFDGPDFFARVMGSSAGFDVLLRRRRDGEELFPIESVWSSRREGGDVPQWTSADELAAFLVDNREVLSSAVEACQRAGRSGAWSWLLRAFKKGTR